METLFVVGSMIGIIQLITIIQLYSSMVGMTYHEILLTGRVAPTMRRFLVYTNLLLAFGIEPAALYQAHKLSMGAAGFQLAVLCVLFLKLPFGN